jgi:hypothetical protein
MSNIYLAVVCTLSLTLINCARRRSNPEAAPAPSPVKPGEVTASCTPELALQRTLTQQALLAKDRAKTLEECEKLRQMMPANFKGCLLADGQLASLEDDLNSCDEKKAEAEEPNPGIAQLEDRSNLAPLTIGLPVFVPRVGRHGFVDSRVANGQVIVGFFNTDLLSYSYVDYATTELQPALARSTIKVCERTTVLEQNVDPAQKPLATGKGHEVFRILAAFANGKLKVQPLIPAHGLFRVFYYHGDLKPEYPKLIDITEVSGLTVGCKEFCPGDVVHAKSPIPERHGILRVKEIFCDGTMILVSETILGSYLESVESTDDFVKAPTS